MPTGSIIAQIRHDERRSGVATDREIADIFVQAVAHKEKKPQINEGEQFQRASRSMSQIGG